MLGLLPILLIGIPAPCNAEEPTTELSESLPYVDNLFKGDVDGERLTICLYRHLPKARTDVAAHYLAAACRRQAHPRGTTDLDGYHRIYHDADIGSPDAVVHTFFEAIRQADYLRTWFLFGLDANLAFYTAIGRLDFEDLLLTDASKLPDDWTSNGVFKEYCGRDGICGSAPVTYFEAIMTALAEHELIPLFTLARDYAIRGIADTSLSTGATDPIKRVHVLHLSSGDVIDVVVGERRSGQWVVEYIDFHPDEPKSGRWPDVELD